MQLSRMHDIAGCRLIFKDLKSLHSFRDGLHKSWMKHIRRKAEVSPYPYDYISAPHPDKSRYRGIHDIYQYCARPSRDTSWDGLLVEIQYRTKAQHAWATANEIAGALTGNHSKFGRGDKNQKEFFRLSSEVISRAHEKMVSQYKSLSNKDLALKLEKLERKINLLRKLKNIKIASQKYDFIQLKKNIILVYTNAKDPLIIYSYDSLPLAQIRYFELEKKYDNSADIVLVRAPSKENLKQAYRNYFSDTKDFVRLVENGLKYLKKN